MVPTSIGLGLGFILISRFNCSMSAHARAIWATAAGLVSGFCDCVMSTRWSATACCNGDGARYLVFFGPLGGVDLRLERCGTLVSVALAVVSRMAVSACSIALSVAQWRQVSKHHGKQ